MVALAYNGLGLGEGGEFNHKKFNRMTEDNLHTKVDLENGKPAFAKPVLAEVPLSDVYLEDCVTALKRYADNHFDLAIVDPPYGIEMDSTYFVTKSSNANATNYGKKEWDKEPPTDIYFKELTRVSKNQIIWGANHFIERINKNSSCWLVWDKNNGESIHADCELAWTSFKTTVKYIKYTWHGMRQQNMKDKEKRIHPTQKPVSLYDFCFDFAKLEAGAKVLDTHLGSGSSRISANKNKLNFVGFEIDEDYFNKQEKRYADFTSQLRMF